ncbi:hypothetical protein QJS66_11110 [Kocuria rhizophila]|nr:hypothetical protein QJS66_11110 [Kocuria rhizophila]
MTHALATCGSPRCPRQPGRGTRPHLRRRVRAGPSGPRPHGLRGRTSSTTSTSRTPWRSPHRRPVFHLPEMVESTHTAKSFRQPRAPGAVLQADPPPRRESSHQAAGARAAPAGPSPP